MLGFFVPVAQADVPRLQPLIGTWREVDVSFSFDGAEPAPAFVQNDAFGEPPVEVLEAVSRAFGDCWWVELGDESFAYQHWKQGEPVRVLEYAGEDDGWVTVEGAAEAWEAAAGWRRAPTLGDNSLQDTWASALAVARSLPQRGARANQPRAVRAEAAPTQARAVRVPQARSKSKSKPKPKPKSKSKSKSKPKR